jgi:hypothetical protein
MLNLYDLDPFYWLGNPVHSYDFYVTSVCPHNIYECPIDYFMNHNGAFLTTYVQAVLAATGALEEF